MAKRPDVSLSRDPSGPGVGSGGVFPPTGFKKRTKVVFLSPTELTNLDELGKGTQQKLIDRSDILKYEELLKTKPPVLNVLSDTKEAPVKKRGRPKGSKNGVRKKPIDPSQPWLEGNESDDVDAGLEGELDDDEYFRRLEEEKLREDEEEAMRKTQAMRARLAARKKSGNSTPRRPSKRGLDRSNPSVNYAVMAGIMETSESEDFSEYGEGTISSFGGSRMEQNDLYPHDEEEEPEELTYEQVCARPTSPTESLPGSRHPSEDGDFMGTETDETARLGTSRLTSDQPSSSTPTDPFTTAMLNVDPIQLLHQSPCLSLPPSATDLVCPSRLLLDAFSVYEILARYGRLLRLSPFRIEDFMAALVANENSTLLSEIHIALLKSIIREDDAAGTLMYSVDCKDSVSIALHSIDRFTWPYVLAAYLISIKSSEASAQVAASGLSSLSMAAAYAAGATGCGPTGGGGADTVLTAALFPSDLIPLDPAYPFVSVDKRLAILCGLTSLLLATGPVRGDVLRDGFLPHEDHCRSCHQSGDVLCCDGCTAVFHLRCLQPPLSVAPSSNWLCPACEKDQTVGVTDCQSEAERAGKVHRREPIGTDRAGRVYWYIGRRLVVEPVRFAQKEPHLLDLWDGEFDHDWPEKYFTHLLQTNQLEPLPQWPDEDTGQDHIDDPQLCSTSFSSYDGEPPVYYYSSFEQVTELRLRLSPRWEPWLCQRFDALLPRMMSEMNSTKVLTEQGLEVFCQNEYGCNLLNLSNPFMSRTSKNVFSLLELETARSKSRMTSDSCTVNHNVSPNTVVCAFDAVTSRSWHTGSLPDDLPETINCNSSDCGVLVVPDKSSCVVRNQDSIVLRVTRSTKSDSETPSTVLNDADLMSVSTPLFNSDHLNSSDAVTLVAYRLSDEGLWRTWTNTYSVGIQWDTKQSGTGFSNAHSSSKKQPDDRMTSLGDDNCGGINVSSNLALTRAQIMEEKERKRLLGNKFNLSELATDLWQYLEPPIIYDQLTRLITLLKIPWDFDDRQCSPSWFASFPRVFDVIRLTLCYFEAQIPLNFYLPAWRSHRKKWLQNVMHSESSSELASALAQLESAIRPCCFQRVWLNALGHIYFERTTTAQREEDRRNRLLDRSGTGGIQSSASALPLTLIRTKTPQPVRHTVWKFRGEEYRRLGGDGWLWLSATRRSPAKEAQLLFSIHPPLYSPVSESLNVTKHTRRGMATNRGLQHGIGWGVCPNYLQGQVPIRPPKPSECRGHVLHPITGIPLYLNPRRIPFILPAKELLLVQSLAAPFEVAEVSLPTSTTPNQGSDFQLKEDARETSPMAPLTTGCSAFANPVFSSSQNVKTEESVANVLPPTSTGGISSPLSGGTSRSTVSELPSTNDPVVLNVSYCLRERIHFPPPSRRPTTCASASRRLRFRLDDLLFKRQTAAELDKRNASIAEAAVRSLEVELRELDAKHSQLSERLIKLNADAQDARTAKAKAVKVKMTGDVETSVAVHESPQRTTEQPQSNSSRQLIQHSVVTMENGPNFRVMVPRSNQPAYAPFIDPNPIRPRRQIACSRKRKRSDDDDCTSDDDDGTSNNGFQLRRSARKQRATRPDPNFVVDFDDDDEEEDSPGDSADSANLGYGVQSAFTERGHYSVRGARGRGRVCHQIPQYDGAGDVSSENDEEYTSSESDAPSVSGTDSPQQIRLKFSEDPTLSDVTLTDCVFQRKPVVVSSLSVTTQSSVSNCAIPKTVDSSSISSESMLSHNETLYNPVTISSASIAVSIPSGTISVSSGTLRSIIAPQPIQSSSQVSSSDSITKNTSTAAPIVLPQGMRLLSNVHSSSIIASPLRLVDGKIVRSTPSALPSNITISRLPPSTTAISTVGSNAVRVIISPPVSTACFTTTGVSSSGTTPGGTSADCMNASDIVISSVSSSTTSSTVTRYQPAILRRTLATVSPAVGKSSATEFKFFTIPQSSAVSSVIASSTARQIVCGDLSNRLLNQPKTAPDGDATQSRRSLAKAEHVRSIPLVENRVIPRTTPVLITPRILPKPNGVNSTVVTVRSSVPNDAQIALDKAVVETSARLKQIENEALSVKAELASVERKIADLRRELSQQSNLCSKKQLSTAQPYSLNRCYKNGTHDTSDTVLLPSHLPPVNSYVWPPVNWPEHLRRRTSTSSLFRWDARNLRNLILAAGRRELPGYEVEKKRLAQVIWPYQSAKPTLSEAWRFRLSLLRLGPHRNGNKPSHLAKCSVDLANLALLLRTLWYCIRWDEMLLDPTDDDDHVLDAQGYPCLRELMDYVDSGSLKSGEPAYCTRKIVGVKPLDRFWQRVNYLVQLTHTVPSVGSKSRKSRLSARSSRGPGGGLPSRRSVKKKVSSGSESPDGSPPRRRGRGGKVCGRDPDYDPAHDEGWRVGVPCPTLSGRRKTVDRNRRSCAYESGDNDSGDHDDDDRWASDSRIARSKLKTGTEKSRCELRVEEQWMPEENFRLWEIRSFMDEFLPPNVDYLESVDATNESGLRRPFRLLTPALSHDPPSHERHELLLQSTGEIIKLTSENRDSSLDTYRKASLCPNMTGPLGVTQSLQRISCIVESDRRPSGSPDSHLDPPTTCAPTALVRRREIPCENPVSPSVLEAKSKARSLAATRAAKASVAARKMKAERILLEQRVRALRSQLIARRRLHLAWARLLAEEAVSDYLRTRQSQESNNLSVSNAPCLFLPGQRKRGRPPSSNRKSIISASQVTPRASLDKLRKSSVSSNDDNDSNVLSSTESNHSDGQEVNEPAWTPGKNVLASQHQSITSGRRGRGRGRGRGVSKKLDHVFTARKPYARSSHISSENSDDLSSAPSTPSTIPATGEEVLERLPVASSSQEATPLANANVRKGLNKRGGGLSSTSLSFSGRGHRVGRPRSSRGWGLTRERHEIRIPAGLASLSSPTAATNDGNSVLYCICKTPYDPTREYLGCDLCQDWFHFECVGLTASDAANLGESWHCRDCSRAETNANEMLYCMCRTPYEANRVYIACDGCDEWYHAECVGMTSQEAASHTGTYLCPSCLKSSRPPDAVGNQSANPTEPEIGEEISAHSARTIYETNIGEGEKKKLVEIVQAMKDHKMSWPLVNPFDAAKYPLSVDLVDYRNLAGVLNDLNSGVYETLGDFSFAMNGIFADARQIFPRDSPEFHCTDVMEAFFIQQMKHFKRGLVES